MQGEEERLHLGKHILLLLPNPTLIHPGSRTTPCRPRSEQGTPSQLLISHQAHVTCAQGDRHYHAPPTKQGGLKWAAQAQWQPRRRQGIIKNISQVLVQITQLLGSIAENQASGDESFECRPSSLHQEEQAPYQPSSNSSSPSPERRNKWLQKKERERERGKRRGSKKREWPATQDMSSSSESSLGESSSDGEMHVRSQYWKEAAHVPGIPRWAACQHDMQHGAGGMGDGYHLLWRPCPILYAQQGPT